MHDNAPFTSRNSDLEAESHLIGSVYFSYARLDFGIGPGKHMNHGGCACAIVIVICDNIVINSIEMLITS